MGVVGLIVGTLGAAWLQGRAQQQQAEAAARQADRNAAIAEDNAKKSDEQAKAQDQANKINAENERRRAMLRFGQQRAAIGASGITASGSAAAALADTRYAIEEDTGMALYNGRQNVDRLFQQSTDYTNQAAAHRYDAGNYRRAGRRAMMTSMLGGAFSLAGGLYSAGAAAKTASGAWTGVPTYTSATGRTMSAGFGLTSNSLWRPRR